MVVSVDCEASADTSFPSLIGLFSVYNRSLLTLVVRTSGVYGGVGRL
jgi:hypothetical protein